MFIFLLLGGWISIYTTRICNIIGMMTTFKVKVLEGKENIDVIDEPLTVIRVSHNVNDRIIISK